MERTVLPELRLVIIAPIRKPSPQPAAGLLNDMIQLETRHDGGLAHDFPTVRRRRMTGLAGGPTAAALAGLTMGRPELATALAGRLTRSGLVREDIRRSFGAANGL